MVEVEEVILGEDGEKLSAADLLELELRDVIEEAEASGLRPERVLELRAMSEREESEMGQRLRGAARRGDL